MMRGGEVTTRNVSRGVGAVEEGEAAEAVPWEVWTNLAAQLCSGGSTGQSHPVGSVADAMGRLPLAMANGQ